MDGFTGLRFLAMIFHHPFVGRYCLLINRWGGFELNQVTEFTIHTKKVYTGKSSTQMIYFVNIISLRMKLFAAAPFGEPGRSLGLGSGSQTVAEDFSKEAGISGAAIPRHGRFGAKFIFFRR